MEDDRNRLSQVREFLLRWLRTPVPDVSGRAGGWTVLKLPLVFVAYALSVGFMAKDPWFGEKSFHWNQGAFVILVSYIIATTLAFEWNLLGRARGLNLLLQFFLIAPLSLLFGRIIGQPTSSPEPQSFLAEAVDTVKVFAQSAVGLGQLIPAWALEPFASPQTAIFLILACIALSYGSIRTRFGLLMLTVVIFAVGSLTSGTRPSSIFWIGSLCMIAGLLLHYHDVNGTVRQEQALRRLGDVTDELERRCSLRICQKVLDDGSMNEKGAFEAVRRHYEDHAQSAEEIALCARTVVHRLVNEHRILTIQGGAEGSLLVPSANLSVQESIFSHLGVWPRTILLSLIALVWLLLPIDALPDTIPFIGLLDDAAILILGGTPLFQRISQSLQPRGGQPAHS